jgi:hypothetical protein
MELQIKPHIKNNFPLGGILIKGNSVTLWLKEIQSLKLNLKELQVYPIPNTIPNTIWGCLIITTDKINTHQVGKNELCQMVSPNLYIPERASLSPAITAIEINQLFSSAKHIIHPEFGLVELTEELNFETLLCKPELKSYFVLKPKNSVFIPKKIKSFQIKPVTPEEILKNLEENVFPKKEKMKDKSLNIFEKGKLAFYKMLFTKTKKATNSNDSENNKTQIGSAIESFINLISKKESNWQEKLQRDFENLEERNKKQVDKLLDLLKNNPEEALKYAIPLDDTGTTRGGNKTQFELSKRWYDLSLFGNLSSSFGNGSVDLGDHFHELKNQYNLSAQELIKQNEHHKAAFIYMKLLKNNLMAAQTLENGNYFWEAATIYLKSAGNKKKAAECYEKGKMTHEAIELYKELSENEKVGDLYLTIQKRKEANIYFEKVIDHYKLKNQYVKASLIYKNKMNNELGGQALLLAGWRGNADAINCLNNYFSNFKDIKLLKNEINSIYKNDLTQQNSESFLQVIQHEYDKKNELSDMIKEMAYEIIAAQIPTNPSIVSEMKGFNKNDKELVKDALRFRVGKKK